VTTVEFVPWEHPSPFLDAFGGFEQSLDNPAQIAFDVSETKVNARGFLHAGVITAIADVAIGHLLAGASSPPTALVTVNLSCDLLGTARLGDRVHGVVEATRIGRRLAAGSAVFSTDRIVARVSGLFMPAVGPTRT
jgi:acyl-coenzyme A thioesterase PaaI-like protein